MALTALNLETPPRPVRAVRDAPKPTAICPTCGVRDRRITESGFGRTSIVLCEHCGHEYKD